MTRFPLVSLALAAIALGGALTIARAQDAPAGDVANGKRVYLADGCFMCHGRSGQGGAYNGPAPVLAKTEMPFDGFKGQLRNPVDDMPAYSTAVMTDQQIADIYAFVRSLPGRRNAKDIPLLND
ncbi:MAG TPA: cytochrome c [Xanthobacteraceae bacterium]|jgi:mono/diheme cytochrome c family protein